MINGFVGLNDVARMRVSNNSFASASYKETSKRETVPKQVNKNKIIMEDIDVNSMSSILSTVCLTEELSDVYFSFPGDSGTRIPAHKTLLSLRSPVFKAMFFGTFPRQAEDIVIDDIAVSIFKTFIRYLYTDEVLIDANNVIYLMYTAKMYMVEPLLAQCCSYLSRNLNSSNACTIYCHAMIFELGNLTKLSLDFIRTNASHVFTDGDFLSLSTKDLSEILKTKNLNIEEVDIFKALLRWADNRLSEAKRVINGKSRREILLEENILYMLAVPMLSMEDYTQVVIPSGILSDEEQLQVFKAITIDGPKKPATSFDASPRLRNQKIQSLSKGKIIPSNQTCNAYNAQGTIPSHGKTH